MKKTIPELRKEKGMTQEELAKELGITNTSLYYFETGKRLVPFEIAHNICGILNVSIDQIFCLNNSQYVKCCEM